MSQTNVKQSSTNYGHQKPKPAGVRMFEASTLWCELLGTARRPYKRSRFLFNRSQPLAVREYTCNLCASHHTAAAFIPTPRLALSACKHKILCVATGISM